MSIESPSPRSEERRVGKECRRWWSRDQAEDGIRDWSVTGVQTCALPIFGEALFHLNLQRTILVRRATAFILHALGPAEFLEERPPGVIVRTRIVRVPGSLVNVDRVAIAKIGRASCRERV